MIFMGSSGLWRHVVLQ